MDINIILWLGGMLFSLGIFAVKVGFGIAFGRIRRWQMGVILGGYLCIFALIAILANRFLEFAEPILKSGSYIHIAMSAGLGFWGFAILLSDCKTKEGCNINNSKFKIQDSKIKIQDSKDLITKSRLNPPSWKFKIPKSILLLIPCPVCITAIGISVSSGLTVLKASPLAVGLVMGVIFVGIAGAFAVAFKPKNEESADIPLGLAMIGVALYFLGSLFIPQKIEEARLAYQSFSASSSNLDMTQSTGVLVMFLIIFALGFLLYNDTEDIS